MLDFKSLKLKSSDMEELKKKIDEINKPSNFSNEDSEFWKPSVNKDGNGYAIVRFLPQPPEDGEEGTPVIKYYRHFFQGPGGYYIENSLTTHGETDPVSQYNSVFWRKYSEEEARKYTRDTARQTHFVSNIFIVKDPGAPENEGTVQPYRYGPKIYKKVDEAMHPPFEGLEPFIPYDLWSGANFEIRISKVKSGKDEWRSYDSSKFLDNGPLFEDEERMQEVWSQAKSLKRFVADDKFKTYDELKAKFNTVMGIDLDEFLRENNVTSGGSNVSSAPKQQGSPAPRLEETPPWEEVDINDDDSDGESEDDDVENFFKELANK